MAPPPLTIKVSGSLLKSKDKTKAKEQTKTTNPTPTNETKAKQSLRPNSNGSTVASSTSPPQSKAPSTSVTSTVTTKPITSPASSVAVSSRPKTKDKKASSSAVFTTSVVAKSPKASKPKTAVKAKINLASKSPQKAVPSMIYTKKSPTSTVVDNYKVSTVEKNDEGKASKPVSELTKQSKTPKSKDAQSSAPTKPKSADLGKDKKKTKSVAPVKKKSEVPKKAKIDILKKSPDQTSTVSNVNIYSNVSPTKECNVSSSVQKKDTLQLKPISFEVKNTELKEEQVKWSKVATDTILVSMPPMQNTSKATSVVPSKPSTPGKKKGVTTEKKALKVTTKSADEMAKIKNKKGKTPTKKSEIATSTTQSPENKDAPISFWESQYATSAVDTPVSAAKEAPLVGKKEAALATSTGHADGTMAQTENKQVRAQLTPQSTGKSKAGSSEQSPAASDAKTLGASKKSVEKYSKPVNVSISPQVSPLPQVETSQKMNIDTTSVEKNGKTNVTDSKQIDVKETKLQPLPTGDLNHESVKIGITKPSAPDSNKPPLSTDNKSSQPVHASSTSQPADTATSSKFPPLPKLNTVTTSTKTSGKVNATDSKASEIKDTKSQLLPSKDSNRNDSMKTGTKKPLVSDSNKQPLNVEINFKSLDKPSKPATLPQQAPLPEENASQKVSTRTDLTQSNMIKTQSQPLPTKDLIHGSMNSDTKKSASALESNEQPFDVGNKSQEKPSTGGQAKPPPPDDNEKSISGKSLDFKSALPF